jgi:PKD repeat protein
MLTADDNPYGSGLTSTLYRIYNTTYDTGWITYMQPIYLTGLTDGTYHIDYYSVDFLNNTEPTNTATLILDNTPPVASFTWTPSIPKVGETVTFDASTSTSNGVTIVSYEWDFGDGEHATGKIVTHTYTTAGTYTITLNVTDSLGFWDIEQKQIQIEALHTLIGDLNGDGQIDIRDISIVARAFGETPERPRWNPQADINKDGKIDIRDIAIVAKNFGKHYP